jgi:hypothetical protein
VTALAALAPLGRRAGAAPLASPRHRRRGPFGQVTLTYPSRSPRADSVRESGRSVVRSGGDLPPAGAESDDRLDETPGSLQRDDHGGDQRAAAFDDLDGAQGGFLGLSPRHELHGCCSVFRSAPSRWSALAPAGRNTCFTTTDPPVRSGSSPVAAFAVPRWVRPRPPWPRHQVQVLSSSRRGPTGRNVDGSRNRAHRPERPPAVEIPQRAAG